MSLALEGQRRPVALRSAGREAAPPQVQDNGLEGAHRAACMQRECERGQHLARRRNLTNHVLNGPAL